MVPAETVLQKLSNGELDGERGRHCKFVRITDAVGVKCYGNRDERNRAFERQFIAWKFDCGPRPIHTIEIGSYFCYTTELVKGLTLADSYILDDAECELLPKLISAFDPYGLNGIDSLWWFDAVEKNFGIDSNGVVVMLDFGDRCHETTKQLFLKPWY